MLDLGSFEVSINPIFHKSSRKPQMVRFVLVTLKAALPANLSSIRRLYILTDLRSEKSDFSQLVLETANTAFYVSYAQSSLTSKFDLNTAILDFERFEVSKNPNFHNTSRRPHVVRFVLVTLRAA